MRCPNCNTNNNYYHKFCYNCGAALPGARQQSADEEFTVPAVVPVVMGQSSHWTRRVKKRHRIRTAILATAACIVLVFFYVHISNEMRKIDRLEAAASTAAEDATALPLTLELVEPAEGRIETSDAECRITLKTNAAQVYVDGEPVDALPDENGLLSFAWPVDEYGETVLTIKAKACSGETVEKELIVVRPKPSATIG